MNEKVNCHEILESIDYAIVAADLKGRVELLNLLAEKLTGWENKKAIGQPLENVFCFINEETRSVIEHPIQRVLREGSAVRFADHTGLIAKDGSERSVVGSGAPIYDEKREITGVVFVLRNVTQDRQTEKLLHEREDRLGMVLQAANMGVWHWDIANNVRCFDRLTCQLLGLNWEKFTGTAEEFFNAVHLDDRSLIHEALRQTIEKDVVYDPVYRVVWLDNSIHHVHARGRLVRDLKGNPLRINGVLWDITERRQAEIVLRESEERYRTLAESTLDAIFIITSDLRYRYVNPVVAAGLGQTANGLIGRSVEEALGPDEGPRLVANVGKIFKSGKSIRHEETITLPTGIRSLETILTPLRDHGGNITSVMGVARDITERKQFEEALLIRDHIMATALNAIGISDANGVVTYVNDAFLRLVGCRDSSEVLGSSISEFAQDPAEVAKMIRVLVTKNVWNSKMKGKRRDGSPFEAIVAASAMRDSLGNITRMVASLIDISEERKLEEMLRQSQKLEAIGILAGGVAHDFNNLLTVIIGYGEALRQSFPLGDPLRADIDEIVEAGNRAAGLTRQLLAFSRKQTLQPKVLNLNTVVLSLEKMLKRLIGEDIDFVATLDDGLGRVVADPGQIEQVIMNLVVNARDAMPQGGKLTIETANCDLDEHYTSEHPGVTAGPHVMLAITDNGCGMDEKTKSRIFEPFFSTKGKGKGTGLGLSTVYGIIKQSGGNIWVDSEFGHGTTFKIFMPRVEAEAESFERREIKSARGAGEFLLVVEDEYALRELIGTKLKSFGYRLKVVANSGEALLAVEEEGLRPELLLTDVVLPGISGAVLAKRLRKTQPGLKVLYMSGYTDNAIVHHGVLDSDTPFIQKPFNIENLADKIQEVLKAK